MVSALLDDLRKYSPSLYFHSLQVFRLMCLIGMDFTRDKLRLYKYAVSGILHDVGKLQVPLEILDKPGKLTQDEWRIMQQHPTMGYALLKGLGFDEDICIGVLQHHEKLDGGGYPNGEIGYDIHAMGRVLTCCDIFAAITTKRSYKNMLVGKEAVEALVSMRGLDLNVVDAIIRRV